MNKQAFCILFTFLILFTNGYNVYCTCTVCTQNLQFDQFLFICIADTNGLTTMYAYNNADAFSANTRFADNGPPKVVTTSPEGSHCPEEPDGSGTDSPGNY